MTNAGQSSEGDVEPAQAGGREPGGTHNVFRGTALLALSRTLDRASTFVIVLLMAPRLGAAGVGAFSVAMALYGAFTLAGQAGSTNFLIREISRDMTRTASYVVHLSILAFIASLALLAAIEALIPHLGYSPVLRASASILLLAIPGTVLNSIQEAAFLAHHRVEFETITTLVSSVAYIAVGAALLLSHHGVPSLMWAYVALEWAATLVYFMLISRYIARLRLAFHRTLAWRLMREMKTFTASSLLQALFIRPEVVILSVMASATQVGYYGAAIRVAELPQFLPEVFMANVFTLLSAAFPHDEQRFRNIQAKAMRSMLAFALPLTALILASAPGIVGRLFGPHFQPSVPLLRILALSVLFSSLIAVLWRSLSARGRQDTVLRAQIAMIGVRLGGGVALIAPLAAIGAAIVTTVSSAIQLGLLVAGAARSGAPTPLFRPAWRLALASVVAGAVTWFVTELTGIWLGLSAGLTAYVGSALLLKAVTTDDRALLSRLRSRASGNSS
jgi:O-antigen/teichoic acid export membrane protein